MTAAAIQAELDSADVGIKAALRAGDIDLAWTFVSRKVGTRIVSGDIAVKLKKHRL